MAGAASPAPDASVVVATKANREDEHGGYREITEDSDQWEEVGDEDHDDVAGQARSQSPGEHSYLYVFRLGADQAGKRRSATSVSPRIRRWIPADSYWCCVSPVAPGGYRPFDVGTAGFDFLEGGEAHRPHQLVVTLEQRVVAGYLSASMEHEADCGFGGCEAEDVPLVDKRGCTPLDRLRHPIVSAEYDVASTLHGVDERMIEVFEPAVDF